MDKSTHGHIMLLPTPSNAAMHSFGLGSINSFSSISTGNESTDVDSEAEESMVLGMLNPTKIVHDILDLAVFYAHHSRARRCNRYYANSLTRSTIWLLMLFDITSMEYLYRIRRLYILHCVIPSLEWLMLNSNYSMSFYVLTTVLTVFDIISPDIRNFRRIWA